MGMIAGLIIVFTLAVFVFSVGLYDDLLERAIKAHETRKRWNPDEKLHPILVILVWIRSKMM